MSKCRIVVMVSLALLLAVPAVWSEEAKQAPSKVRAGFDIRIREEAFDNIPIKADPPGVTRGGENDYFRFRTRVWTEVDPMENVTLRARAVNEWRLWNKPEDTPPRSAVQRGNYNPPDEIVFDNLSLEVKKLLNDKVDVKIGRQDLSYGTGKLVFEGTPKDGSRTIYFDAAKLVIRAADDVTVDVFGIWDLSLDPLAINDADRDLTGEDGNNDGITDSGAGIYVKDNKSKTLPFEVYALYKTESEWIRKATTTDVARLDLGTFGFRLMPQFNDSLSGNLEAAIQLGEQGDADLQSYGGEAFLKYLMPFAKDMKPTAEVGWYLLSGDDPSTTDKIEGWNPLWARYPQYSELYIYAYDADGPGKWNNLSAPRARLAISPTKWLTTSASIAYLWAMEDDGPGDGKERGLLGGVKAEFVFAEKLFSQKDKLTGHALLEVLEPGDYYKVDDTAWFARWELAYAF